MVKDLLYCLEIGFRIIIVFMLCLYIGIKLDIFFNTQPIILIVCLCLAFIINIGMLLNGGKHE